MRLVEIKNLIQQERVLETGTAHSFTLHEKDRRVRTRESQISYKAKTLDKWDACRVTGNSWREG